MNEDESQRKVKKFANQNLDYPYHNILGNVPTYILVCR